MKWLLINIVIALAGYYFAGNFVALNYEKPAIFLLVFSSLFLSFWLLTFLLNRQYFFKVPKIIKFIGFILKELFISNLRITYDVLTPGHRMNPAIIALPLDAQTDIEIVALAILITFTPGTLGLKVSEDKRILYIHEMYIPDNDVEAAKKRIKNGFERRLLEITR
ncbi:MAG: Na+/H+ antiporter subunit E [Bacteroidetes bacterium]|nr:Na+/H+ antiporter subunit E [Bacteroidota bacterium]